MPAGLLVFAVIVRGGFDGFGLVAGVLDRGDDGGNIGLGVPGPAHGRTLRVEMHRSAAHAGHALDGFGHVPRAVVAGHAADGEISCFRIRRHRFARLHSKLESKESRTLGASSQLPPYKFVIFMKGSCHGLKVYLW